MSAGNMRRRLLIQARSTAKNQYGDQSVAWTTVATVWGSLEPASAKEMYLAQQRQAEVTHTATMRYRADLWSNPTVAAQYRVVYTTNLGVQRILDVSGLLDVDDRHRMITLSLVEGKRDG